MWSLIKNETKEAALSSTIHGVGGIFRSKLLILQISWFILLLASSGYCAYAVLSSIRTYLNYEVVTNVYTVTDIPAKFPRVTICNQNPIQTEFGLYISAEVLGGYVYNLTELNSIGEVFNTRSSVLMNAKRFLSNRSFEIGLTLEEMLISCTFINDTCNLADFTYSFSVLYGNCYTFNGRSNGTQEIKSVKSIGAYNGLVMELYAGAPINLYSVSGANGIHVYIENQTLFSTMNKGFPLPTGAFSFVEVSRVFTENLPQPYSECTSDDDIKKSDYNLVQMILNTSYEYKLRDCLDLCYQSYLIKQCQCQDGNAITDFPGVKYCLSDNKTDCLEKAFGDFYSMNVKSYCNCPVECNNVDYNVYVSSLDYPSLSYYEYLQNNTMLIERFEQEKLEMTYETMKRSVLAFSVNYADLVYTKIETSAKTSMSDLIGQIGGFCGLFVGMSFLSFFEIAELGIMIIFSLSQLLVSHKSAEKVKPRP